MTASVATREFLTGGEGDPSPNGPPSDGKGMDAVGGCRGAVYLPVLLPPMCLNRYALLYSVEPSYRGHIGIRHAVLRREVSFSRTLTRE